MIKYAVKTERFEFNPTKYRTAEAAFIDLDDHSDETIGLFDAVEEARAALALVDVNTSRHSYKLAVATVAYIEVADYELNEDGEWEFIEGRDIDDFKQVNLDDAE
jgi:hypothetical protein